MGAEKQELNLAQRKIVAQFEEKIKTWKASFDNVCGTSIPVECHWDTFFLGQGNMSPDSVMSNWQSIYFDSLMAAFASLCGDAMGKDAVKNGVKKVVINGADTTDRTQSTFDKGVFTINHKPLGYSASVSERGKHWQKIIENSL